MTDLMRRLTVRTEDGQLFPFPEEGGVVEETPPCLSWLPLEAGTVYEVTLYDEAGEMLFKGETLDNYLVPAGAYPPGKYFWDLSVSGEARGRMNFVISGQAVSVPRPTAGELYAGIPEERPRQLFTKAERTEILKVRKLESETLKRNILKAYEDGLPERPYFKTAADTPLKPDGTPALPYREYFGRFREYIDRNLAALSLGYGLLGDEDAGTFGKKLLFTVISWGIQDNMRQMGPAGDEVGLSLARCLPAVYDLLYPLMDEEERHAAGRFVYAFGKENLERLLAADYPRNPGSSHVGRIAAYLGEAAVSLKGTGIQTKEEALQWLDKALSVYNGFFPHYGTPDGGWAEGTFYSTSYTKWYLPFFSLTERFTGKSFFLRPFYERLPLFFLHFADPSYENHPFGDGYWCRSSDPEWPGFFAQNPLRIYAERSGDPMLIKKSRENEEKTDIFLLHLLDVFLPAGIPALIGNKRSPLLPEAGNTAVFPEAGFGVLHSEIHDPAHDLALLFRASKFGSGSHRHPDQGSFALFYGGVSLISPSGYFGRQWGSVHHRHWLNTTKAHNVIVVDGVGQPEWRMEARGKIESISEAGNDRTAVADLTEAYPMLTSFKRTWRLSGKRLVIEDEIRSETPVTVLWPLHMLSLPEKTEEGLRLKRKGVSMRVIPAAGTFRSLEISDQFDVDLNAGEPEAYHVTMPPQYHAYFETEKKAVHSIRVEFTVIEEN